MKSSTRSTIRHRGALLLLISLAASSCSGGNPPVVEPDIGLDNVNPRPAGAEATASALTFTGGTPQAALGEPVRIGWLSADSGPDAAPEATAAALAAAEFVNTELGGIQGRPLELVTCDTGGTEQAIACSETLAQDPSLIAVLTGRTPWAPDETVTALAGIPVSGIEPRAGVEYQNPGAAYFVLGKAGVLAAASELAVARGDTGPIAIVVEEGAASQAETFAQARLAEVGIDADVVEVGREQQETLNELVTQGTYTTIIMNLGPDGCIALGYALDGQDGVGVITSGQCAHATVYDEFGDWVPGWVHIGGGPDLANYDKDPHTAIYRDRLRRYAGDNAEWTGLATLAFALVMNVTRIANSTDELTRQTFGEALTTYSGPGFMAMPEQQCGYDDAAPALCQHLARAYRYAGKRVWENIRDDFLHLGRG